VKMNGAFGSQTSLEFVACRVANWQCGAWRLQKCDPVACTYTDTEMQILWWLHHPSTQHPAPQHRTNMKIVIGHIMDPQQQNLARS
jgi:hypothetical protein